MRVCARVRERERELELARKREVNFLRSHLMLPVAKLWLCVEMRLRLDLRLLEYRRDNTATNTTTNRTTIATTTVTTRIGMS